MSENTLSGISPENSQDQMLASKSYLGHLQAVKQVSLRRREVASWLTEDGERKLGMPPLLEILGRGRCPSDLVTLSCVFMKGQHR